MGRTRDELREADAGPPTKRRNDPMDLQADDATTVQPTIDYLPPIRAEPARPAPDDDAFGLRRGRPIAAGGGRGRQRRAPVRRDAVAAPDPPPRRRASDVVRLRCLPRARLLDRRPLPRHVPADLPHRRRGRFSRQFHSPLRPAADLPATPPGAGAGSLRDDDRVLRLDPLPARPAPRRRGRPGHAHGDDQEHHTVHLRHDRPLRHVHTQTPGAERRP